METNCFASASSIAAFGSVQFRGPRQSVYYAKLLNLIQNKLLHLIQNKRVSPRWVSSETKRVQTADSTASRPWKASRAWMTTVRG